MNSLTLALDFPVILSNFKVPCLPFGVIRYILRTYIDTNNKIVARVKYNEKLDYWNGRNWGNGGLGMHKGITKLKDGRFVIIIGSQMQGSKDYAYIVSKEEALQEVLKSGNLELLEEKKFVELKTLYDKLCELEEIDEAETTSEQ